MDSSHSQVYQPLDVRFKGFPAVLVAVNHGCIRHALCYCHTLLQLYCTRQIVLLFCTSWFVIFFFVFILGLFSELIVLLYFVYIQGSGQYSQSHCPVLLYAYLHLELFIIGLIKISLVVLGTGTGTCEKVLVSKTNILYCK